MSGFGTMLAKELREIQHTWRIWVTLGTFAFFGIADPVIARFSPEILASVVGDEIPITLPPATAASAWAQWTGDLAQLLALVIIAVAGASVAGEVASGTAILPLAKPIGRPAFVLAKFCGVVVLAVVSVVLGTALATGTTALLFDELDVGAVWAAAGVWLVLAVLLVAVTMFGSALVSSTMAAFLVGFGAYMLFSLVGIWQPARAYSPAGLNEVISSLAAGQEAHLAWPVGTALGITAAALAAAVWVFRKREL